MSLRNPSYDACSDSLTYIQCVCCVLCLLRWNTKLRSNTYHPSERCECIGDQRQRCLCRRRLHELREPASRTKVCSSGRCADRRSNALEPPCSKRCVSAR